MSDTEIIKNEKELEFAIFCIENLANRLKVPAPMVYTALAEKSDILTGYIIPCYEALHTQGKEYIVDDILETMKIKGVQI